MKILLIEDNQSICKGLEYAFKSNGYECDENFPDLYQILKK